MPVASLARADLERLREAARRSALHPSRTLFDPRSAIWRVNREAVVLLGGGRALLLQVAHPLVAAGVAAHSDFRRQPLQRLRRTLDLMLTIVFADAAAAMQAVHAIERVHARVHGVLAEPVGPFPRGTPYHAADPALLMWVFATLVDTALLVYERFVEPLGRAMRLAYYAESQTVARLLGVPPALVPPTLTAFEEYVDDLIEGEVLTVGPAAREIAASIMRPSVPPGLREMFRAVEPLTVGLLPPALRERYGLTWGPGREVALAALAGISRRLLPVLPAAVRFLPHSRRAPAGGRNGYGARPGADGT